MSPRQESYTIFKMSETESHVSETAHSSDEDPRDYIIRDPAERRNFRVQSRKIFLTFPQTDFDLDTFFLWLDDKFHVTKAIACKERHQTGELHIHVAVEFLRKLTTRNPRYFDYAGHHPNFGPVRTWGAAVNYCRKEPVELRYFKCGAEDAAVGDAKGAGQDPLEVCRTATSYVEWLVHCMQNKIQFGFAKALWDAMHDAHVPTYSENVALPTQVTDMLVKSLRWSDDYRALVICGPSGIGKTSWALANAPTPFLLVTDPDDLRAFDPLVHKSIIFDEIRCTGSYVDGKIKGQWPLTQQIKLCTFDTPVSVRCRYANAKIPARVPKIFTCTDTVMFSRDPQIERRIHVVNLYVAKSTEELWFF